MRVQRTNPALYCAIAALMSLACGASLPHPAAAAGPESAFDGRRALELLRAQCRLGPRPPATDAHTRCLDWITTMCRRLDLATTHQSFSAYVPLMRKTVRLTNVIAVCQPSNPHKIMLSAHWDTRPIADRESSPARRNMPILGANDGASGVAVLLELARVFREHPPNVGLVFAFFDGEDLGEPAGGGYCLGSQYLADHLEPAWRIEKGINLDMVGARDLTLPIEGRSWEKAQSLALAIWEPAAQLYPETFRSERGTKVFDDHVPFLSRNIPYVDIIGINYAFWHTLEDTEDKCSASSLERVGRVIARFVLSL
jgi:hypothetical protein